MNVDVFTQQIQVMHRRLDALYQGVGPSAQLQPELLPLAFKELGTASEELQVAIEELLLKNEELALAQTSLEVERQRYQELFEFAPNGYLVTDELGTIKEANRAAAKLLNIPARFLVGKPLVIFVAEEERQLFHWQLSWLQQAKREQDLKVRLFPRNGEPFDAVLTMATASNWEGKPMVRICIRNLTIGKRAEVLIETNGFNDSQERPKHIYLKGEIIPLKPKTIWQVCKGIVKLSTMSEKGEEVLVGLAGPGMPFGSDLTALQTYQAIALSEAQLVCFSVTDIAASPVLAQILLPKINQRLQQTESLLAISGQRHVKDRFYRLLQMLKQEVGQPVTQGSRLGVRFTHQDLADACSTTRVTITRLLGKLQEQGRIVMDSKNHIILVEGSREEIEKAPSGGNSCQLRVRSGKV